MNDLEKSRQHIQKMGKLLYRLATIAKIILIVMIVAQLALTAAILISPKAAMFIGLFSPRLPKRRSR